MGTNMIETQIQTDIMTWEFDFSPYFPSADTLASATVLCSPAGLVELSAKSSTSGHIRKVVIDAASATASTIYILGCQATSSTTGIRKTLYKSIYVLADETGSAAIAGSTGYNAYYSANLVQVGTGNPAATVLATTLTGTPAWTRSDVGIYYATLANAFPVSKTTVACHLTPLLAGTEFTAAGSRAVDGTIQIKVRDVSGNLVDGFLILGVEIKTYT